MSTPGQSRRDFLLNSVSGLGAAWVGDALFRDHRRRGIRRADRTVGTSGQVRLLHTGTGHGSRSDGGAQIIPTDATPGAREARVINFIDRALVTFEKTTSRSTSRAQELETQTKQLFPNATKFSALTPSSRSQVLTAMEKSPFFNLVRTHTVTGFFASPVHGGNANKAGWKLVSYNDSLNHKPPFGYYDAPSEVGR
jgi:hypothetical protein